MKYHLVTLGCQMNISDSGRVKSYIEKVLGGVETANVADAELVGVIACSVRQKAIDKVYNMIAVWNRQRHEGHQMTTFLTGSILPPPATIPNIALAEPLTVFFTPDGNFNFVLLSSSD